jgi:hypothetical protein
MFLWMDKLVEYESRHRIGWKIRVQPEQPEVGTAAPIRPFEAAVLELRG